MERRRTSLVWWYWLLTGIALGARLAGWTAGLGVAMALTAVQAIHLTLRARRVTAFPVQVRVAYMGLLVLGSWAPLVHWAQLCGTACLLVFDYCPLARMLSLLPWNRRGPLTLARLRSTFLTPPVQGSIVTALDRPSGARAES
jgi:hypothetical protein